MSATVVDLFCGIGGLTKGLELAGLNVSAGIDIDANCRFAYEANNKARFMLGDVNQIPTSTLAELFPEKDAHILVGCAPCQPFSKYTQRYRKEGHTDDKWRLLYAFIRFIDELKPDIVSMENVPELIKENVFADFIRELKQKGYFCSWSVVYCPDYGVPQKRKRLVLLASLMGELSLIPPLYHSNNYLTVRDAIGQLSPLNSGEVDNLDAVHCSTKLSKLNIQRVQQSTPGGTWRDWDESLRLACHKKETGKTYASIYGRMCWDKPSPTITTQFYGYGNGRFGHPEQDRAISWREGSLLQSFPKEYRFIDNGQAFNRRELGTHIGNAVPVELGRAIGISICQHLKTFGVECHG